MRHNPKHASTDPEIVRQLIRENPWAIIAGANNGELIASHYPVLLDEQSSELAVFTHVGRPDDQLHGFGEKEVLLIVQGRHGYVSPSWYAPGATRAPTWNFSAAHCTRGSRTRARRARRRCGMCCWTPPTRGWRTTWG